jgi:hypothetical protein
MVSFRVDEDDFARLDALLVDVASRQMPPLVIHPIREELSLELGIVDPLCVVDVIELRAHGGRRPIAACGLIAQRPEVLGKPAATSCAER